MRNFKIKSIFSPLSFGEGLGVRLLFLLLFLASCSSDDVAEQPGGQPTGRTVRREVTVQAAPMLSAQGNGATRAQVPLNEDEQKIHSLWVLQFGGTTDGSKLIKKTEITADNITNGTFFFDFDELAGGGQITVCLLANIPTLPTLTVNTTTITMLKAANLSVTALTEAAMKTSGLPMIGWQSFDYTTSNPAPFALGTLLAKVSFQYATIGFSFANVLFTAENLASAVPVTAPTAGSSVQYPSGITRGESFSLVSGATYSGAKTVCYLPENLSGQVSTITKDSDRGGDAVPQEATFLNVDGNSLTAPAYRFYVGDGTSQDFNMKRNYQYTFDMKLRGANDGDKRVTVFTNLSLASDGVTPATANCYLIAASGKGYYFDATKMGKGVATPDAGTNAPAITPSTLAPASVKVLWEQSDPTGVSNNIGDVVTNVELSSDKKYISFTSGTKSGNAVIAAYNSGGTLIWSWHIWHPETNPGDVECYTTDNGGRDFKMMGLNLGAFNNDVNTVKAFGLLYQWGRKDPFPGDTSVSGSYSATFNGVVTENGYSFEAVKGAVTEPVALQNPMRFYYSGSRTDWVTTRNDNLWGNPFPSGSAPNPSLGSKSIYDPCPVGYRVPPQDTWGQNGSDSDWATNTNGQNLKVGKNSAKYFYPAAGVRWGDSDAGKLANAGSDGYYWSSSPGSSGDESVGYLYFYDGNVFPLSVNYRAHAMSVRCMKE